MKQENLLPCHKTTNKLKNIYIEKKNFKMSNKCRETNIKNRFYYFFDDMIKIKNLEPDKIKNDKKSHNHLLHWIRDDQRP